MKFSDLFLSHVVHNSVTFNAFDVFLQHNLLPTPARERYTDDDDELTLEDEAQRVSLSGNIPVQTSVTGTEVTCEVSISEQSSYITVSGFECACHLF